MVAREGSAPPTSGCRPYVMLFHHRAETGCRGWICTNIRAFKGRCPTIRRPGKWWPAPVTLRVPRLKRPRLHFKACRPENGARGRNRTCTGDALDVVSLLLDYASKGNGFSSRCCPGSISLQKKSVPMHRDMEAKWSQSPVLPWARLAYDACLNAGSTAVVLYLEPPPEVAPS